MFSIRNSIGKYLNDVRNYPSSISFSRLLMDRVFSLKRMIILLKHRVKHRHHHIGQQLLVQHRRLRIDSLNRVVRQLHLYHKQCNNRIQFFFLFFLSFECCLLCAKKEFVSRSIKVKYVPHISKTSSFAFFYSMSLP